MRFAILCYLALLQGSFFDQELPRLSRYISKGIEAAPYVALALATVSFAWASYRLYRKLAWRVPVEVTLLFVAVASLAFGFDWLRCGCAEKSLINATRGFGLALMALSGIGVVILSKFWGSSAPSVAQTGEVQ